MIKQINPVEYLPDISIYPGQSLADILESRNISQAELARRMNKPVQAVNEIIMGKKEIIPDTAIALEHVLGLPAGFWLRLESNYRESLAREKENGALGRQIKLLSAYPYKEMTAFGWVKERHNAREKVTELLKWLGVADLTLVPSQYEVAFRKSDKFSVAQEKLVAWLRHGEIELQNETLGEFNKGNVEALMDSLRSVTSKEINIAHKEAKKMCADFGIALVFTPEFKSFPVSGATRWVGNHPLVQVSLRFKTDDHLWFSIFHELGHVFKHKKDLFIENKGDNDHLEEEANAFAASYLIPHDRHSQFVSQNPLVSESAIILFASEIGVAPGIIVGRLQHDKKIRMDQHNHLKKRLHWKI